MDRTGRRTARLWLAGLLALAALVVPGVAVAADEEYVKYYAVKSQYDGKPENLTEIAARFLGNGNRSSEIFNLNAGRTQPDGKALNDGNKLRAGWYLVLPWDAVGSEVKYGVLPTKAPTTTKSTPAPKSSSKGSTATAAPATTAPAVPDAGPRPSASTSAGTGTDGCATAAASSDKSDWARLRLAPQDAWPQSRGKGQTVAIVDSGVNGSLRQLAGHVLIGTDVTQAGKRGDTDCLGTGTAMAALIVAQQTGGVGPAGAAPDASVYPVRLVGNQPTSTAAVQAKGIETAVASGAKVIALGNYIDATDTTVAKAVQTAIARDAVVVLGAPLESKAVNPQATLGEGALRVAGVGVNHQWPVDYRKGAIDVSAPGVNVSSLGGGNASGVVSGSGTHLAVAYTAAVVALVRAAYPDLTAQQVTHRVKVTSEKLGDAAQPSAQFGWGMIDPAESVTKVLAEEAKAGPAPGAGSTAGGGATGGSGGSGGRAVLLIVTALLLIAAALLLVNRIRNLLRNDDEPEVDLDDVENDLDLYDTRLKARDAAPVLVSAGPPPAPSPPVPSPPLPSGPPVPVGRPLPDGVDISGRRAFDDGGESHWREVGGHWSDGEDPQRDSGR